MARVVVVLGSLFLLMGASSVRAKYQLDLTTTNEEAGVLSFDGLEGWASVESNYGLWEASLSIPRGEERRFTLTMSAPLPTYDREVMAHLEEVDTRSQKIVCQVDAHDGMIVLPDVGCACLDVDILLAFRCPGEDGAVHTKDDELFVFRGTLLAEAEACQAKPTPWFPDSLETAYRTCQVPAPAPAPPPPVVPVVADDHGGCNGTDDSSDWSSGDDYGCEGYEDDTDWGSDDEGGCGGYEDDSDWSSDDSGCEGDDSDWGSDESAGCEGDDSDWGDDTSCEGDAYAAVPRPSRRARRFWPTLGVNLPTILVVFVGSLVLRRRRRRSSLQTLKR